MTDRIFADGFIAKKPHEKVQHFVKANVSIKVTEAIAFLTKHQEKDWVNLDLLESKDTMKLYFQLNTYKPETKVEVGLEVETEIDDSEIPF